MQAACPLRSGSLAVVEAQQTTKSLAAPDRPTAADDVLIGEVVDDLLLTTVQPACHHVDEEDEGLAGVIHSLARLKARHGRSKCCEVVRFFAPYGTMTKPLPREC